MYLIDNPITVDITICSQPCNGLSRDQLPIEFSDSRENKANVAGLIANGIKYTPFIV